jgi:hypothetical protein
VPNTEQSVGGAKREEPGAEQSANGAERQVSSVEQSAGGAKALSVEHGAIREQHGRKESSAEQFVIGTDASSVEHRVKSVGGTGWTKRSAEQSVRGGESQGSSAE